MQLHQLLRIINNETFIVLLDLNNKQLYQGTKVNLPVDYYEYNLYRLKLGSIHTIYAQIECLYIILEK